MRPLIAGNWKMFGLKAQLAEIARLGALLKERPKSAEIVICPPATLLAAAAPVAAAMGAATGAQDCHTAASGAFTGDISAEMAADAGAQFVIVGHSERRQGHGETSALVRTKADAVFRAGLTPIICIGETRAERESGKTLDVLGRQIAESVPNLAHSRRCAVAYEPVWAIGTGLTPTSAEIEEAHAFLRERCPRETALLYGGSVKPSNAAEILRLRHVGGVLVGGASLKAEDFFAIIQAA
jgi:triosephosphate isomerase